MQSVHFKGQLILFSRAALTLSIALLLSSCGGGSSGTGTRRIDGSVLSTSSLPIEGATVSVLENRC